MATRIRNLAARVHRFRMLRQLGFDTSMLLRTGGKQAMTYGLGIIGVSDDMLRDMRRVAAAIASPASGTGGKTLMPLSSWPMVGPLAVLILPSMPTFCP